MDKQIRSPDWHADLWYEEFCAAIAVRFNVQVV